MPNIADYDVVFVNAGSLTRMIEALRVPSGVEPPEEMVNDLRYLDRIQSLVKERLRRVLRSGGRVFGIVQPNESITLRRGNNSWSTNNQDWVPLTLRMHEEPGDTLELADPRFDRYFRQVKRWSHVLSGRYDPRDLDHLVRDELEPTPQPKLSSVAVATDRQKQPVAAELSYVLHRAIDTDYGLRVDTDPYFRSGPLVVLPPSTECADEEAIRILLEDLCGMQARTPPPAWLDTMKAPGEEAADGEIEDARAALAQAQGRLRAAETRKAELTQFKEILYETGAPLQEAVRRTFEAIGIRTGESPVSDEFMLLNEEPILVEVTGGGKSIAGRDLSQLIKDIGNYVAQTEQPIKGVLVGNAWRDVPPNERDTKDRPFFPDNVIKTANNHSVALLSTIELFNAYCAAKEGKLSGEEAMKRIRDGVGVISLAD